MSKRPCFGVRVWMRGLAMSLGEWASRQGYYWKGRKYHRSKKSDSLYISLRRGSRPAVVVRISDHFPSAKCAATVAVTVPVDASEIESVKAHLRHLLRH